MQLYSISANNAAAALNCYKGAARNNAAAAVPRAVGGGLPATGAIDAFAGDIPMNSDVSAAEDREAKGGQCSKAYDACVKGTSAAKKKGKLVRKIGTLQLHKEGPCCKGWYEKCEFNGKDTILQTGEKCYIVD